MTVIDLAQAKADREPHLSGAAVCLACKHEWVAVAPVGTVWMECPACSIERGRYNGAVMSKTTLTDGSPVTPDHREIDPATGQQKGYVVLSAEERAKGFVRPVRQSYVHDKCGGVTTMGLALAETYARDPSFYSGTFCAICRAHFPVGADGEFTWKGTTERVGT